MIVSKAPEIFYKAKHTGCVITRFMRYVKEFSLQYSERSKPISTEKEVEKIDNRAEKERFMAIIAATRA
jgi:hypothetical protein